MEKIQRTRPKSLDLDAIDFEVSNGRSNLAKMPSMPDGMLTKREMNLRVGPGTYYGFEMESNTLPRRNVKRNEFPWESMPKDWTTSVKLREISKRNSTYTDRQSSSGEFKDSFSRPSSKATGVPSPQKTNILTFCYVHFCEYKWVGMISPRCAKILTFVVQEKISGFIFSSCA